MCFLITTPLHYPDASLVLSIIIGLSGKDHEIQRPTKWIVICQSELTNVSCACLTKLLCFKRLPSALSVTYIASLVFDSLNVIESTVIVRPALYIICVT